VNVQPDKVDGYLIVARDLFPAVVHLSGVKGISARSCAMLAAHVTECWLKALIFSKDSEKKFAVGEQHDLIRLWSLAEETALIALPKEPPDWLINLAVGHGPNFYFRYQQGVAKTVVNGGQTPEPQSMVAALDVLGKQVTQVIGRG
jgi:hypothetical protein